MSIGRTFRATSLAFSLALALSCAACTSEPSKNLFGDAPDNGAGANNGTGSKDGSGGSSSEGNGGSKGSAAQSGRGGSSTNDTGGETSSGATTNGGGGATSAGGKSAGGASSGGVSTTAGGTGSGGKSASAGGQITNGGTTGSGGTEIDSGTGASGGQDSGASTGGSPPMERRVRCGDTTSCDLNAGESCCVRDVSTGMGPTHQVATCVKDTSNCDRVFRCDSDADCAHGEHCCLDFNSSPTMPSATCSARACDSPLSCSVPADCPSGKTCCGAIGTVPMVGIKYTSVTCEDTCKGSMPPSSVFCVDDSVCSTNTSCLQSATLPPGYLVCRVSGP